MPKESKVEETNSEILELKHQYLLMGKKIDALKSKKASILKSMPVPSELRKVCERLRQKYETLSRVSR